MSSYPGFIAGSYQSASSVIESYRRVQAQHSHFVAGSTSSSSLLDDEFDTDSILTEQDEDDIERQSSRASRDRLSQVSSDDAILANVHWDEEYLPGPSTAPASAPRDLPKVNLSRVPAFAYDDLPTPRAERAPLLTRASSATVLYGQSTPVKQAEEPARPTPTLTHRISNISTGSRVSERGLKLAGQSTYGQTLLNAIAVLFGIGMLSEPLAFAYAGWIGGTALIIGYGLVTCYTAKILAHIVLEDPRLRSYSDIGRKAFGPRSVSLISTVFCLELFTVSVALVTLYGDSLHAVVPAYSSTAYKILGLAIFIPAVMLPLSVLSYASILGIFSLVAIIAIILFDGFTKPDSPGSLWSPAETSLGIDNYRELGLSFGLFMAGFAGHAAIPTLARDMIDPSQFDHMINWAFGIATAIYGLLGVVGYVMFGNAVSDEFSQDLIKHNIHPSWNTVALWGLVITPLTKYALSTRPFMITLEIILGIDTSGGGAPDHSSGPTGSNKADSSAAVAHRKLKSMLTALVRTGLTVLSVATSILIPEFASVMAVLGATFSFALCIIGPLLAKIAIAGRCGWHDGAILAITLAMAVWGTVCAFQSASPL